ncbi:terminase family protein [Methylobacterium sp. Leaf466]|uniref:DNA-packaging protein n=1 Tax=Methylobacterium sp. Leaf466 TaxID=1736386 RepID=UPI0009EC883C|nr:terminase family protein [Methylobacterium sp. Leaf466]
MRHSQATGRLPAFLASLPPALVLTLARDWLHCARPDQLPPCEGRTPWTTWAVIGGRGSGKTRTGAEWVRALALGDPAFTASPVGRIALVGETFADVRDVMIEGPSGLLALAGPRPVWSPSRRRVDYPNGAVALAFSAEEPDSLRGPQFGAAWSDELAKWRQAEAAYDMIQFGLRLGARPRSLVTTTPRPTALIRRLLTDPSVVVSRSRTADNAMNLAPSFLEGIVGRYAGTRLGRQELDGELIEDRPDALWNRAGIEAARVARAPDALRRIVVAVDPPASSRAGADACGIVAAGLSDSGHAYVLADATLSRATPQVWALAALTLYHRLEADALVVEVNQGGEMASAVIAQIDPAVPVTPVRASRGKYLRAEPVSVLYARGLVHHVGALAALEDELCDLGPDGLSTGASPDRLDALVWALTHLMLRARAEPRIRGL